MQSLNGISGLFQAAQPEKTAITRSEENFGQLMTSMIEQVNGRQKAADQAIQDVHAGGAKNLHEAMIALEKADISTRYLVQVRNKVLDAYQEIMRMQV